MGGSKTGENSPYNLFNINNIRNNNNNKKTTNSSDDNEKLKQKIWNDFLSTKSQIKDRHKFVNEWINSKTSAVNEGAKFISKKRAYKLLSDYIKDGKVTENKISRSTTKI